VKRVKVTRSYQVTIPVEVRKFLGIRVGDYLSVSVVGNRIVLEKVEDELPTFRSGRKVGEREIEETLAKGLARSLRGGQLVRGRRLERLRLQGNRKPPERGSRQ